MKISALVFAGFAASALLCLAGSTRTWLQSEYPEFEKGNLAGLSVRSDGRLTLAPKSVERFDSSSAYLWALAQDSQGNLYTGGGPGAKLFRVTSGGGQKLAEFDALEVHAIAVDGKDTVYAGTSPDGKVYKVSSSGKSEQFYDPRQKYIWAMVCDGSGNLYIATGDGGEIHRVSPDGKGSVFFKSDETHIRSLAFDGKGNLIAGTEPGGLIIRVNQRGEGFVLYEMGKREITAVAVAPDGGIYAAGVGAKQAASPSSMPSVPVPPAPSTGISLTVQASPAHSSSPEILSSPTPSASRPIAASGSTDVYCIHRSGYPEKMWSSNQDVVYAIAFDSQKRVLLGAGNKGSVYRIDTNSLYTSLLKVSSNQITALQTARDGSLFAATGNVGKIYRFGAGLESQGTLESDLFDAGAFTSWGRLMSQGELNGGKVTFETRSGNLDRPGKSWSPWSGPITAPAGGRITSPPARFLQWRATLTGAGDRSPDLDSVEVAYLPRNIAPRIEEIEMTPPNYKYAPSAITVTPSLTPSINLPPIGKRSSAGLSLSGADTASSSMTYAKGWLGARWSASDENGDTLSFNVEIRGVKETTWKLLRDKIRDRHFSFDSTAFPDGEYRLRIAASDLPSNTSGAALTTQKESNVLLIDNTPPKITGMRKDSGNIRWKAVDALNVVKKAEYSVDGGDWTIVNPLTELSDSLTLDYQLAIPALGPGEHTIAVRVTDDYDNSSVEKIVIPG